MKHRILIPLIIVCFLLQGTFFSALPVFGVSPDLVLAVLLLLPLYYDGNQALWLGFVFGLLRDICFGIVIGPTAILYCVLALAVSLLRGRFYAEKFYTVPLVVLPGTVLFQVLYWGIMRLLRKPYAFGVMAKRLPALLVLELVWCTVLYLVIGRNARRFSRDRELFGERRSRA